MVAAVVARGRDRVADVSLRLESIVAGGAGGRPSAGIGAALGPVRGWSGLAGLVFVETSGCQGLDPLAMWRRHCRG
jgi:hypothetical protein